MVQCFVVNSEEIKGKRLDCRFHDAQRRTKNLKFPTKELKELLLEFYGGGTPSKTNFSYWEGNIPWVSPKDMRGLSVFDSQDHISEQAMKGKGLRLMPKGAVLIVFRSGILQHTLPVAIVEKEVCINQDLKALVLSNEIFPKFLVYYFNVFQDSILPKIIKHSTTVQSINTDDFLTLPIPILEKKVQQKIIDIMDTAYKAKREKEAKAQELLNGIDDYVLGELGIKMPEVREMICYTVSSEDVQGGRMNPSNYSAKPYAIRSNIEKSKYKTEELSKLLVDNFSGEWGVDIDKDSGSFEEMNVLRNTNFENLFNLSFRSVAKRMILKRKINKVRLKRGDILIEKSGGSPVQPVGRVGLFEKEDANYTFSNFVQCLRLNKDLCLPSFLFSFLKVLYRLGYMEYIQNQTTGIKNLIMEDFLKIQIPIPKLPTQERIAIEVQTRMNRAKQLRREAQKKVIEAKEEVEGILLN